MIGVIINAVLQAALTRGAAQGSIGGAVDMNACYKCAFAAVRQRGLDLDPRRHRRGRWPDAVIIPGLIFAVFLSMAIPAFIVENRGVTESMCRSWNLVTGRVVARVRRVIVALISPRSSAA